MAESPSKGKKSRDIFVFAEKSDIFAMLITHIPDL
jgi:hypothetical protein